MATALLPALYAATSPDARGGRLYGPDGLGQVRGGPAEQALYRTLRSAEEAECVWRVAGELAGVSFGAAAPGAISAEPPAPAPAHHPAEGGVVLRDPHGHPFCLFLPGH